ncbi:hypothetical protein FOZ60_013683 [Perkinsus olseni]|uniref:Uncharacterized protein n=1 Tax=Perkinsus olseni TaxID=32597 RepID=A0A7J6P890_PEROL|nr:hypothetical protein FOZ60_013683 [Perkinsus olseni]
MWLPRHTVIIPLLFTDINRVVHAMTCYEGDQYCKGVSNNNNDYCMYWKTPSTCHTSYTQTCSCDVIPTTTPDLPTTTVTTTQAMPTIGSSTAALTTVEASTTTASVVATTGGQTNGPPDCTTADIYCSNILAGSYCKHWSTPSYCQGTSTQCSCTTAASTTTPPPTTTLDTTTATVVDTTTLEGSTTGSSVTTTDSSTTTVEETTTTSPTSGSIMKGRKGQYGVFNWLDNAIWCSPWGWQQTTDTQCVKTDSRSGNLMYVWEPKAAAAGQEHRYMCGPTEDAFTPVQQLFLKFIQWAELLCGNPPLCTEDGWLEADPCYGGNADVAREHVYRSVKTYIESLMFQDEQTGDIVRIPISLMQAGFRSLRFGMVLGQHVDPIDGVQFGGRTQLNADCSRVGSRCEDTEQNVHKQGPLWSKYYPNNEAATSLDDYDLTINYINRVFDFLDSDLRPDIGPRPVIDIYLDIELFQLSHVSPLGDLYDHTLHPIGTGYPGSADYKWGPITPLVSTSCHDRNNRISDSDWQNGHQIRTTLSGWMQQAYNWVSPRWAVDDTVAEVDDTTSPYYGLFTAPFGTGKVLINGLLSDWECPCCVAANNAAVGDANYVSKAVDDFSIVNCMHRYLDGVSVGTYQTSPAQFFYPWQLGRSDTAVDIIGPTATVEKGLKEYTPGDGVPLINGQRVDFTNAAIIDINNRYRYNPMGFWPNSAAPDDNTPSWTAGVGEYWDMKYTGWASFGARYLRQRSLVGADGKSKMSLALETTPLDGAGVCSKNSLANEWGWTLDEEDKVLMIFGSDEVGKMNSRGYVISNAWGIKPALQLFKENGLYQYMDPVSPILFNEHFSYTCLITNDHIRLPGHYMNTEDYPQQCLDPTSPELSSCDMPQIWA